MVTADNDHPSLSCIKCSSCKEKLYYRPIGSPTFRSALGFDGISDFNIIKEWILFNKWHIIEDAKNGYPIYCHSCYLKNKTDGRVRRECGHIKELEGKLDSYREYVNISVH